MKINSLLFILCLAPALWGKESMPDYFLESSTRSDKLQTNEALFHFRFEGIQDDTKGAIHLLWAIDNQKSARVTLQERSWIEVSVKPGKHRFQFFYNEQYIEISTSDLEIKGGYLDTYVVHFSRTDVIYTVEKPVIYLYPEKETQVDVKVESKGKMLFTYPQLNDSWQGTAYPNGDLNINGAIYPYLFWEAAAPKYATNWNDGFVVQRADVVSFLEKTLTDFGLNSTERADFITYWAPRMVQSKACVIHFLQQNECNQLANLSIVPQPDHVNRIYILWSAVEDPENFEHVHPQHIQSIDRSGFDVLEWGGQEFPENSLFPAL